MKLVLEIEFLMGRYVATSSYEYDTPEWPPHPDRVFSALVAAYKETDLGQPERDALEWLETLPMVYSLLYLIFLIINYSNRAFTASY